MLGHWRLETFALCFSWLSGRALEFGDSDYNTITLRLAVDSHQMQLLFQQSIIFINPISIWSGAIFINDLYIHSFKNLYSDLQVTTQKHSQLQCGQKR